MINVYLKNNEGRTIKSGGFWIFDNEIDHIDSTYNNGDIVAVYTYSNNFLCYGYINDNSKIRIRMLTRNINETIDDNFFYNRILNAWNYRKDVVSIDSCRVVFSESDFLPGLIIDKFENYLVFSFDTLGMDIRKEMIIKNTYEILSKDFEIKGMYERSDARTRSLEGLERYKGFIGKEFNTLIKVNENGVDLNVNIADGQKTGYFLDQKYNHLAIRELCKDKDVLDCFTHTGGFALSAAKVAKSVIGVDASELAINQAKENSVLNNFDNTEFVVADVFEYLPSLIAEGKKFDVVVLDPPAFTKSHNSIKNASKGYQEINMWGASLVKNGGYLVTCSCSEYMNQELFEENIRIGVNKAKKQLRIVERRMQGRDHPMLVGNNVSTYLKCIIYQIIDR